MDLTEADLEQVSQRKKKRNKQHQNLPDVFPRKYSPKKSRKAGVTSSDQVDILEDQRDKPKRGELDMKDKRR